ncbi:MAG: HAMP domain-containing protein [Firmicutes bacterium]|nr:HAMP domain-containing protein [Bacillota bacterium]
MAADVSPPPTAPAAVAPTGGGRSLRWPLAAWFSLAGGVGAGTAWALLAAAGAAPSPGYLVPTLALAALAAAVLGYRVAWGLRRRLRPLLQGVAIFAAGGMRHRIRVEGDDEVGELAQAINAMAERHAGQVEALQRLAEERLALSGEAARAAVLEERQRLARDLHDAVSQAIFSIAMMTAAARRLLPCDPEAAAARMAEVEALATAAQREMRALLLALRPVELAGRPLEEALAGLVAEVGERYGLEVAYAAEAGAEPLPPAQEDALFRIAQEAVVNAIRHGHARRLEVRLAWDAGRAVLSVWDDGRGFDPAAAAADGHYGLRSMRERAREMGGELSVDSAPGRGTRVEARLPRLTVAKRGDA